MKSEDTPTTTAYREREVFGGRKASTGDYDRTRPG
jgi:hypothetical protein